MNPAAYLTRPERTTESARLLAAGLARIDAWADECRLAAVAERRRPPTPYVVRELRAPGVRVSVLEVGALAGLLLVPAVALFLFGGG